MAQIRYEPWNLVVRLDDDFHRTRGDGAASATSGAAADRLADARVDEHVDGFEHLVDLPGMAADNAEIALADGASTLSATRRHEPRTLPKPAWPFRPPIHAARLYRCRARSAAPASRRARGGSSEEGGRMTGAHGDRGSARIGNTKVLNNVTSEDS